MFCVGCVMCVFDLDVSTLNNGIECDSDNIIVFMLLNHDQNSIIESFYSRTKILLSSSQFT